MGGIYGFAGFQEEDLLSRMARRVRARGPEDAGYFLAPEGPPFAMGQSRPAGEPGKGGPAFAAERRIAVVMAGGLLGRRVLRDELVEAGAWPAAADSMPGDAALLAAGYELWGLDGLLGRLLGPFAFCVWDGRHGTVHLVRDHCGREPLYYTQSGGRFLFASNAKALLESAHVEARLDLRRLDACLAQGYPGGAATLFAGIHCVPSGQGLHLSADGRMELVPWWQAPLLPVEGTEFGKDEVYLEALAATWEAAWRAVEEEHAGGGLHLETEVGSVLLAATAARSSVPRPTFSVHYEGVAKKKNGETPTAALAARLGTEHHEFVCTGAELARLPKLIWQAERPLADPALVAWSCLLRQLPGEAASLFDARGGATLFGGDAFTHALLTAESHHRLMPSLVRQGLLLPGLALSPWKLPGLLAPLQAALGATAARTRLRELLGHYARHGLAENDAVLRAWWGPEERHALYTDEFKSLASAAWTETESVADQAGTLLDRLLKLDLRDRLAGRWLPAEAGLATPLAIEPARPWLDHRLAEFAFTLPPHLKRQGKRGGVLLRQLAAQVLPKPVRSLIGSAPGVPEPPVEAFYFHPAFAALVADTLHPDQVKKRGFFVPVRVAALVEAMQRQRDPASCRRVFALVALELWQRVFLDRAFEFEGSD